MEEKKMKIFLTILTYIIPILFGYLMGSVLYGKHIAKKKNIDITAVGSMNSGGTNVGRTVGKWFGILTMVLDALKCYISCLVVFLILSFVKLDIYTYPKMIELVVCLTGLSCAFGHAYPIFDHFKGGKMVSCFAGFGLFMSPAIFLFGLIVFIIAVSTTKRVSIGSISCAVSGVIGSIVTMILDLTALKDPNCYNGGIYFTSDVNIHLTYVFTISLFIMVGFLIFRHKANIIRLKNHSEPETHFKK